MAKLKKILVTTAMVLGALLVVGLISLDWVTKMGIEIGASRALGVTTRLEGTDVGVFTGRFALRGLDVVNPDGFRSPSFLKLADGEVTILLRSLMRDEVVIPNLTLAGIELTLEKNKGRGNYNVILDNLRTKESPRPSEPQPDDTAEEGGKGFIIHDLLIRGVTVHADVIPLGGELSSITIDVPEIRLKDVGSETGTGSIVAQLSETLVKALLDAVVKKAGNVLPNTITEGVDSGLQGLKALGEEAKEVGKTVEKAAEELGQSLEKAFKGLKLDPKKDEQKK